MHAWLSIRDGYHHALAEIDSRVGSVTDRPAAWSELLRFLRGQPDRRATMHAIADALGMSSGGLTRLVDRMADDGLLIRSSMPSDRRVVLASLTDAGIDIADRAREAELAVLRTEIFSRLTPEQIDQLDTLMTSLRRNDREPAARSGG